MVAHAEIFRIHWSMVDRDDDQHADREIPPQHVEPGERQAVAEHADDQRADQRADDRAAPAEQRRCRRSPRR